MIDEYGFGAIVIDGRRYTSDVIVYPDRIDAAWWRKEGHCLVAEDLGEVLAAAPEVLVVGTGKFGLMRVPAETRCLVEAQGIELHAMRTGKAVELYNTLAGTRRLVGAFHLTC